MESIIKKALEKIKACPVVKVEFEANKITIKGISPDKMEVQLILSAFVNMRNFYTSITASGYVENKKAFDGEIVPASDYKELTEEIKQIAWEANELRQFDESAAYDFLNS